MACYCLVWVPRSFTSQFYGKDFPAWFEETAQLLTERRFEEIDLDVLIDEVLGLSRREKETVKGFLETIIERLLKLAYAPTPIFDNNFNGWTNTMCRTRRKLGEKLDDCRALSNYAAEKFNTAFAGTLDETKGSSADFGPVDWPMVCPWTIEQVQNSGFFPSREFRSA